ncbi:DNA-binding transcriptional MerR regulator [Lachnotalea glycerini]|uniref:DNA-binding transcriptional MerR regulator n=1 Tax=Lachnotalea glycerini TaxID=1763509 RepID=A0A318EP26_9FIRM|nr:MerR family transcriptional regulator [Lachnotalea glycerini]OYO59617.1 hypothetical protein CG709_18425 [Lachnotalea glycerini]PXV91869.1 DNA-binding transcriptional MerR regulator [Lachnotalea glycerini]
MDKSSLLTTGQMAKIHGINKRTLMYYDDIGLFSPVIKDEKGFRYYTYEQCLTLESILAWRELDLSIESIKNYNKNHSPEAYLELVEKKEKETLQKINHLKQIRSLLISKASAIRNSLGLQLNTINIEMYEEEYLLSSPVLNNDSYISIFSSVADTLKNLTDKSIYFHSYGSIISVDKLANGSKHYERYYVKLPRKIKHDNLYVKPAGTYLQIYWTGNWSTLPDAYNKIFLYAKDNKLKFADYSYEESIIDHTTANSANEYVTKILIRLKT